MGNAHPTGWLENVNSAQIFILTKLELSTGYPMKLSLDYDWREDNFPILNLDLKIFARLDFVYNAFG